MDAAPGRGPGATVFADEVHGWLASPEQGVAATVELTRGAQATAGALARLAPSTLTVVDAVATDGACWAEVTRSGAGEPETCLAGLTFDAGGRVARVIWLRAPLVPSAEAGADAYAPGARPVLESYFADLMASRFREAAAHFAPAVIYSHPPYAGGESRVLYRGREALWRGFATDRGPSPARQMMTNVWQRGGRVFVEGVVEGIPNGGTFFSTAEINAAGEIDRYVAFYSLQRIPG